MALASSTSRHSVLVVEDNPDIVIGLQDLLEHDGYNVTVARSCAKAIEHVRTHHVNAILLDLTLPDGDGIEVLKAAHSMDATLPVVIVTANTSTERTERSYTRGAFAYLTKPYNREELKQTLRRAIGVKELTVKVERVQHLLSESEDRFRSLVESATDAIVVADHHGRIISWNRAATRLFGYTAEDAIGQPLTILMPHRYRDAHEKGLARMASTGQGRIMGSVVELCGLKQDGTEFPIELSLATWKNTDHTFYSGIIRDISDRKRSEEALAQNEQLLRDVVNNTTAVIYVKYADGRYLLTNRRFEQLFNVSTDRVVGFTDHDIFPKDIADAFRANDVAVLERNATVECEEYAPHSDGLHTYISIKFPLRDKTGKPYATCGISTDITERKRLDDALRATRAEPGGIWDWDLETARLFWSPQVDLLLGIAPGSVRGTQNDLLALMDREDRDAVSLALRQALEQQRSDLTFEHHIHWPDGTLHRLLWAGHILRDHTGRAVHMMGTVRELTERKENRH